MQKSPAENQATNDKNSVSSNTAREYGRRTYNAFSKKITAVFGTDFKDAGYQIFQQLLSDMEKKLSLYDARQSLNPNNFGISKQVKMFSHQQNCRTVMTYNVPESNVVCKETLENLDTFIRKHNASKVFCQFQWIILKRNNLPNSVLITVYQQNPHINPQDNQSSLKFSQCIKEISKAYAQLTQESTLHFPDLKLIPENLFTSRAITTGAYEIKINLIQGLLQFANKKEHKSIDYNGLYLSEILNQFIDREKRYKQEMSQKGLEDTTEHFLTKIKTMKQFHRERDILDSHPLFLNPSERRILIQDASDFCEYYNNKEQFCGDHPEVNIKAYNNITRILMEWTNYNGYLQEVDGKGNSQRPIYNWLIQPLQESVILFSKFNVQNKGKPFVEFNFRDHLRFIRNSSFHPQESKKALRPFCRFEHVDELLAQFQKVYPRFITFVYDFQCVQHRVIEDFLKESLNPNPQFKIQLPKFTPRAQERGASQIANMMEKVFDFRDNFYWKHLDGQIKKSRPSRQDNDAKLYSSIINLNVKFTKKLEQYNRMTNLLTMTWRQWADTSNILYKNEVTHWITWFNKCYLQIDTSSPIQKFFTLYLKVYFILQTNPKVLKHFMDYSFPLTLYALLASKYHKDSYILNQFYCPHFAKGHCKSGNNCGYKHHRAICPQLKQCNHQTCQKGHHPTLCRYLEDLKCQTPHCKKSHWPICPDFYWGKCTIKQCRYGGWYYHPPTGVCISQKKGEVCYEDGFCNYYHPKKVEIPQICRSFAKNNCKKGVKCSFFHPQGYHQRESGDLSLSSSRVS